MSIPKKTVLLFALLSLSFAFVTSISTKCYAGLFDKKFERNVDNYEKEGKKWGEDIFEANIRPENINTLDGKQQGLSEKFVAYLISEKELYYFGVHSELKEAFKKGFRQGYQERTADLVLGPHLQMAAGLIGKNTATSFVDVINAFEKGWKDTLDNAVKVFITLIAEGSQADREEFIKNFVSIYGKKYADNREIIAQAAQGKTVPLTADSGMELYLDPKKTQCTLNIPSDTSLKVEIYKQTFREMGYEMGDRYAHNLISRNDLVDWLRRSRTALNMDQGDHVDPKTVSTNLNILATYFKNEYGTDSENVFAGLAKEAGYDTTTTHK